MVNYYNQRMNQFCNGALILQPYFKRPEERVHRHNMITRSQKYNKNFNDVLKQLLGGHYILYDRQFDGVECHDCGEISKCYDKKQGVSMGGEIYDYYIGHCCKDKYDGVVGSV